MARQVLQTEGELQKWLSRQSRPVKWCVAPETGRTPLDGWAPYSSVDELPRGCKLLMRAEDAKGGVHVYLSHHAVPSSVALSIPDRAALQQRQRELDDYKQELLNRESQFLEHQRMVQAEHQAIAKTLDERLRNGTQRALEVEREFRDYANQIKELLGDLRAQIERADAAESSGAVAASISYSIDKLLTSFTIWRAKSLKDVPASLIENFKGYMDSQASRRFLEYMPGHLAKLANTFMDLSAEHRNAFLHSVTEMMKAEARAKRETAEQPASPAPAPASPAKKPKKTARKKRAA